MVVHTFNPRRQRQKDLCEFKVTPGYTRLIQKQIRVVVAHTFNPSVWESRTLNPSTREVETGTIWLGGERNIRGKRQELTGVWTEVWQRV